jgi:hypothetical protein
VIRSGPFSFMRKKLSLSSAGRKKRRTKKRRNWKAAIYPEGCCHQIGTLGTRGALRGLVALGKLTTDKSSGQKRPAGEAGHGGRFPGQHSTIYNNY